MHTEIAIVTGGAGGLGSHVTTSLSRLGTHVVVADVEEAAGASLVVAIESEGNRATFVHTDASEVEDVRCLFERLSRLGPLSALVHTAGGQEYDRIGPAYC